MRRSKYSTAEKPPGVSPGGELPGPSMPDRGQSLNSGFGASETDLKRGHRSCGEPDRYESDRPWRDGMADDGFLSRPIGSFQR